MKPTRLLEEPFKAVTNDGKSIKMYLTDQGLFTIQELAALVGIHPGTLYDRICRNWQSEHVFDPGHAARTIMPLLEKPVVDCDFTKLSGKPRNRNLAKLKIGGWELKRLWMEERA